MNAVCLLFTLCLLSVTAYARPVQARPVVSVAAGRSLTPDCVVDAAREHGVPLAALMGILAVEGGTVGEAKRNSNGSWDLGPYQVNTCNLNALVAQGFSPESILLDGCENARAAAWILRQEYERTGDIWSAVGAYHSRTPELRDAYIARVRQHLMRMMRSGNLP